MNKLTPTQKLWYLLNPSQRRAALYLLGLMLVGMVMETLGIGLVIPALALMTQSDLALSYPFLVPWLNRIGNPSHEQLVVAGMLTLVVVYLAKELFLGFLSWWQARFVFGFQADLSHRLFTCYLRQPYAFHLQRNSAQLIRNTIGQVDEIRGVVQMGLLFVAEGLVLLGIISLLLYVEPLGTFLVGGTLGLAGWGFQRITRERLKRWGFARQLHEGQRIQHLQQGLGGVKDVKLLGREGDFLAQYQLHNSGNAQVGVRQTTLMALPKLWLEFLAVSGLAVLVLVMIAQGKPIESLLPTLGLFAAAAFRLMPSVNRVLNSIQNFHFSLPVINNLHGEIRLLESISTARAGHSLPFKTNVSIDQLSFQYALAGSEALHGISLSIPLGTSVGFIGTTGAGKSTLVDVILGLLPPSSGTVKVDGIDIQPNLRAWQDQIGYVPQLVFLTDDTLRRNVAFGLPDDQIDDCAVWRAIRAAQLEGFVSELPGGLKTVVGERGVRLSGGQRQRIGIARALYHDPNVLVLDEATSSLDSATENEVMDAVRALQGDKTIIIVAHRLSTVEYCNRLFRLEHGVLVEEGETVLMLKKRM